MPKINNLTTSHLV